MISLKHAVYPVVAAAALVLVAWQPMESTPVAKPSAVERSVSNDMGRWLPAAVPVVASSASPKV